jgi:hypothetical protein
MKPVILACLLVTLAVHGASITPAHGQCEAVRAAVAARCPCNANAEGVPWKSRGRYIGCVKQASGAIARSNGDASCTAVVDRCAGRSVCGRAGAVTCIIDGKCDLEQGEDRCIKRGGRVSGASSCCDVRS